LKKTGANKIRVDKKEKNSLALKIDKERKKGKGVKKGGKVGRGV